jgi:hypothetical protein
LKIFLDEDVPRKLAPFLSGHEVHSVVSPSYSPILGKKAMDVAENRNLIHGSDCDTESRIN